MYKCQQCKLEHHSSIARQTRQKSTFHKEAMVGGTHHYHSNLENKVVYYFGKKNEVKNFIT
jgi:uncharacterized protein YbcV (DUF1398 family)